jgi:hypothetical protein
MQRTVNLVLLAAAAGFVGSAQQISNRGNSFREPTANTTIRLDTNLVLELLADRRQTGVAGKLRAASGKGLEVWLK